MNPMQQTPPQCGACSKLITDRYKMQMNNEYFHETCLQCLVCGTRLSQKCFAREGKLFCKYDYYRLYVNCLGCSERISAKELVMRASDYIFHLRCFSCVVCGAPLQKGDQYVIRQCQLFCRPDYEKEVEMMNDFQPLEYPFDDTLPSSRSQDGRRGPKRPRTILTTQQRRAFKASFEVSPKPSRKVREILAKDTGLSVRIVQVWFQNQRAKMKKMQKKAKLENKSVNQNLLNNNSNGSDSDCTSNDKLDIKDEKNGEIILNMHQFCESPNRSDNEHSLYSKTISKDIIDTQNNLSYYRHTYPEGPNGFTFSPSLGTMDMDDKNMNFLQIPTGPNCRDYEIVNNGLSHHSRLNELVPFVSPNTTPIDRLYSMNATYFREEHVMPMDNRSQSSPHQEFSY